MNLCSVAIKCFVNTTSLRLVELVVRIACFLQDLFFKARKCIESVCKNKGAIIE